MLSRVAESLYWMARNGERTENNAHILGVQLIKTLEAPEKDRSTLYDWETILEICSSKWEFEQENREFSVQSVMDYLAFSESNPNSLSNAIANVRENARMTQTILPNDLWEVWNALYLFLQSKHLSDDCTLQEIHGFLEKIHTTSMTATGIIDSRMSRDLPYHFMRIGKWLERAEKTAIILKVIDNRSKQFQERGLDEYYWRSALQLVNGFEDYAKKFRPHVNPNLVLQFLLTDRSFPRSIRYCMEHVRKTIIEIEGDKVSHYSWRMYAVLDKMKADFDTFNIEQMNFQEVEDFIQLTLERCIDFSKIFSETYYLIETESVI